MQLPPRWRPLTEAEARALYRQGEEAIVRLLVDLSARVAALEARLAQDSRNSNRPPSSDGLNRPPRHNHRPASGKKPGGQNGHPGSTLRMSPTPDQVIRHRVNRCDHCHRSLRNEPATIDKRQVYELPSLRLQVTEHQAESKYCPCCDQVTTAAFPEHVLPGATYGERFRSLGLYLQHHHFLPCERTAELLQDLFGHRPSPGTLVNFQQRCATNLMVVERAIKERLRDVSLLHEDETGIHCAKTLHWLHTLSTGELTLQVVDRKRGREAMDRLGILPQFTGKVVHDHLAAYFEYGCRHVLCNAHHLRELRHLAEVCRERWAARMHRLLLRMKQAVERAVGVGATALSAAQRRRWRRRYDQVLAAGKRYHRRLGPPLPTGVGKRGRKKQWPGKNLLDRLQRRKDETLAFLDDFTVPFTNNLAERDLRMAKVKEKVSGCFRSVAAARDFYRIRSYISTARKQGWDILEAIAAAVRNEPLFPEVAVQG